MKALFCAAIVAAMTLSTGVALANDNGGEGGGNGGLFGQPNEVVPSGFNSLNTTFQVHREMQAYVINQEQTSTVAQSATTPKS